MSYFFFNNKKELGVIKNMIEEYSGVIFKEDKIFYSCEYCNFYIASKDIVYNVSYNYPGRELIMSKETINKKICCHCYMRIIKK